jgi:hypothetical protein
MRSFSTVESHLRYSSAGPSQVKRTIHSPSTYSPQLDRYSRSPYSKAHPAARTDPRYRDVSSVVPEVDETCKHVPTAIYHPPEIPNWSLLFHKWLQARRRWALDCGVDDPVPLELLLAGVFDAWLQAQWPLLHNQGLAGPTEDPSRWIRLFDFWLLMPVTQGLVVIQQPLSSLVQAPTNPSIVPTPILTPSASQPQPTTPIFARVGHKKFRDMTSMRTVMEIQQECEERGGEKEAIQRLSIVFPETISRVP